MSPAARRGLIVFLLGVVVLAGAMVFDYWWLGSGESALGGVSIGGPFALSDQDGKLRHDTDFRGKLMLVYFGYTYCPDACPTTLLAVSQALDELGPSAQQVDPIFITVDPARDTVAQMKLYAANFSPRLIALTGSPDATAAAAKAYRVYYQKVPQDGGNYLMDHTSFLYLMGRDGRYLTHLSPGLKPSEIAAAIKRFL
jgi:protein SCO1/2